MISSGVGFHLLREVGGPIVRPYMEAKFKDSCCIIIYTLCKLHNHISEVLLAVCAQEYVCVCVCCG